MDERQRLKLAWAEYRFRMERFELAKEKELIQKYPSLSSQEIDKKLNMAVERRFKQESNQLMQQHLNVTNPFRKL